MFKLRRVDIERSDQICEGIEKYKQEIIEKLNPQKNNPLWLLCQRRYQ